MIEKINSLFKSSTLIKPIIAISSIIVMILALFYLDLPKKISIPIGVILSSLIIIILYKDPIIKWVKRNKKKGLAILLATSASTAGVILIEDIDLPPITPSDSPIDDPAFDYIYPPSLENKSVLGNRVVVKNLNKTTFWKLFRENSLWQLEAQHPVSLEWLDEWEGTNLNQWLNIERTPNIDNTSEKINLTVTNNHPTQALKFRFSFAIDLRVKNYINESSTKWNYILTFQANETEEYNVFFNFSDIKSLVQAGKIHAKHGIKTIGDNEYFWFRIISNQTLNAGNSFTVDPHFGNDDDSVTGSASAIWACIRATAKTFSGNDGTPVSFNFYGVEGDAYDVVPCIYDSNDNLLATLDDISVSSAEWYQVNFSNEFILENGVEYKISLYTENGKSTTISGSGLVSHYHDPYSGVPPDTFYADTSVSATVDSLAYIDYEEEFYPIISNPTPANEGSNISMSAIYNVTVTDLDGNNSAVDFYISTDNATWTHIGKNTTILNQSVSVDLSSNLNDYSQLYYMKVTANDAVFNSTFYSNFVTTPYRSDYFNDSINNIGFIETSTNVTFSSGKGVFVLSEDIDDTFGKQVHRGATNKALGSYMYSANFIAPKSGDIKYYYLNLDFTVATTDLKIALYLYSDLSLIGNTTITDTWNTTSRSWFKAEFDTPLSVTAGTRYCLAARASSTCNCYYNAVSVSGYNSAYGDTLTFTNFPENPWTPAYTYTVRNFTFYAGYTYTDTYSDGNFISKDITLTGTTWDKLYVGHDNDSGSVFSIVDTSNNELLGSLTGNGDDISSVTNGTIRVKGVFTGNINITYYNVTWITDVDVTYNATIRNDGIDYFVYLGGNISASDFDDNITGFDSSTEYIAIWNNDSYDETHGWWQLWYGDGTGTDLELHTFDIIKIYLDDSGTQTIDMLENTNIDYTATRSVSLVTTSGAKNYVSWTDDASTTANDIADTHITTTLDANEIIYYWNSTTHDWDDFFIVGFWEPTIDIHEDDVIMIAVTDAETLEIGGK